MPAGIPPARGRLRACVALSELTWFRVGGPAEVMFRPADVADLSKFLRRLAPELPVTVLGVGSNVLVRDGGIAGVVIRLGGAFARVGGDGAEVVTGAGALDGNVALAAAARGLAGLEFLSGIPGTIGGALRMNAGAYGREMRDVVVAAEAVDRGGTVHRLGPEHLGFGYRPTAVPESWIFTRATLRGTPDNKTAIAARIDEIRAARERTQPVRERTGGSTFKNPPGR
ncbi:MAG: UDP-N-acetylmuramate dehydrogenase, partial [Proteobacteria bacterium]|nr:UDP-N-acetylmuramate dehydrogenase [Pseudomonadota bacterium]